MSDNRRLAMRAIWVAAAPIYAMVIVAALNHGHGHGRTVVTWKYPPEVVYARCVPIPVRGQAVDGSWMYFRDERIRLSQCWEDI